MKSNYKLLGDYITRVDIRNKNLETTNLKGLSMTKEFRDSTSNIVGVDLSKYKLVPKNHFACDFMSVIRVHKLPVVHQNSDELIIVSPAYTVFKVIDESVLNPEYLMMWFRRPEFDRYADFRCDSAIRGGFKWDELGEVELPIPTIEKQREIVKEYNTIVNRIKLNETLNQKLEDTAQALYKHWFVDFEFPNADGKPYQSSGGEMVYNAELDLEIPLGWKSKNIASLCKITSSKRIFESEYKEKGVPFYRAGEIRNKKEGIPIKEKLFISRKRYNEINEKYGQPLENDILMTAVGSLLGDSYLVQSEEFYFKDGNVIWFKDFLNEYLNIYLFEFLRSNYFNDFLDEIRIGSGQSAITIKSLGQKLIIFPEGGILKEFSLHSKTLNKNIGNRNLQNSLSHLLKDLILSKMSKTS